MSVKKVGFVNRIFALLLTLCISASIFLFWSVQAHAENEIPAYSGSDKRSKTNASGKEKT